MRSIVNRKTCLCIAFCPVPGTFDRPTKAVFSADGTTAFVLNCGPECGGNQASISFLPVAGIIIQSGAPVPPGAPVRSDRYDPRSRRGHRTPCKTEISCTSPGSNCNPTVSLPASSPFLISAPRRSPAITPSAMGPIPKMNFADDNTLWIGSQLCTQGERYHLGATTNLGCLTMFNTANNSVTMIDSYKGDATGVAAVLSLHKVYTAEGGQVYIYSTVDGSSLDNSQVTVVGTAYDVAYMDSPSDANNTTY